MPFEPFTPPPATDPVTAAHAHNMAAAAGDAVNRGGSMALGYLGYRSGKNHYEVNGDLVNAAWKGGGSAFRWWVWGSAWVLWMFTGAMYAFGWWASHFTVSASGDPMVPVPSDAMRGLVTLWVISPFFLGVTWCRFIDFSLFKRGFIYHIFRPLARIMAWCPTWALFSLIFVAWIVA